MFEAKKDWLKVNTESLPLVLDELTCELSAPNTLYKKIINTKNPVDISTKNRNIRLTPCGHNSELDIVNKDLLVPRIEIVTENRCCSSVTHQCLIFPPQTPIKVTIQTGEISLVELHAQHTNYFYQFSKFKNWFHQYLTFWLFFAISLVQLGLNLYSYPEDSINVPGLLSYTITPKIDDGLQEANLWIYSCGQPSPSS